MIITTLNVVFPSLERAKYNDFIQDNLGSLLAEKFNLELVYSDDIGYRGFGVDSYYSWSVIGITDQVVAVNVHNVMLEWFKSNIHYLQLEDEGITFFNDLNNI